MGERRLCERSGRACGPTGALAWSLSVATLLLVVCGLASGAPPRPNGGPVPAVSVAREVSPQVSDEEQAALAAGNLAFAVDLHHALRGAEGNLFYSPYSITLALAMTYAGARGETAKEMAGTLHFDLPQDRLHPALNALDQDLATRAALGRGDGRAFELHVANALWGQRGHRFLDGFLRVLGRNYGAGLRSVDFAADPEAARLIINRWFSEQTAERISDLIARGVLRRDTKLVLANTVYFLADWQTPFKDVATRDGPFHLLDGSERRVPMMHQTDQFSYCRGAGCQLIELPYRGYKLAMTIILPQRGELAAFESDLSPELLTGMCDAARRRPVQLALPKFRFDRSFSLRGTLSAMGMGTAFGPGADLSGMDGTRQLFIDEVVHKAFVAVDEEGTEAAAATAVVTASPDLPPPKEPLVMTVDRPFLFVIRDRPTNTILFMGRVVDPTIETG